MVFKKNNRLEVGIIEGYWYDCNTFWYNIRISSRMVYTYSDKGDIAEDEIIGKVESNFVTECRDAIMKLY